MIINRSRGKKTVTWNQCPVAVKSYLDEIEYTGDTTFIYSPVFDAEETGDIVFSSNATSIATVTKSGNTATVTGISSGTAAITATLNGLTKSININVDANGGISAITGYAPATAVQSNTKPIGKTVDGVTYYNEVPNVATPFSSTNMAGTVKPLDRLRWIRSTNTLYNCRDLGGWACDGGTVKYGMLIRGAQPDANDRAVLVRECGIRAELDLRGLTESGGSTSSPLGDDVQYCRPDSYNYYSLTDYPNHTNKTWKEWLRFIFNCVNKSIPVYFHCTAGADRTGTLACILEALLGVSQSDIDKDYELTCFSTGTADDNVARRRNERYYWAELIRQINALTVGTTFRDKVVNWVASLGFTAEEINAFRAAMIDGTPETLTPIIATYTVTKSGEHVAFGNSAASINQYQDYVCDITPDEGYVITGITVKVNGVDVSASCVSGNTVPYGTKTITENGDTDVSWYETASVEVAASAVTSGSLSITENGTYDVTEKKSAVVNVQGGITPSGTLNIAANGTYDVTNYASAAVNVAGSSVNCKIWDITVTSDHSASNYVLVSDSVLAAHKADTSARVSLFPIANASEIKNGVYMIQASNAGMFNEYKQVNSKYDGGSFSSGYSGALLTSGAWGFLYISSGGELRFMSNSPSIILPAGNYRIIFTW